VRGHCRLRRPGANGHQACQGDVFVCVCVWVFVRLCVREEGGERVREGTCMALSLSLSHVCHMRRRIHVCHMRRRVHVGHTMRGFESIPLSCSRSLFLKETYYK